MATHTFVTGDTGRLLRITVTDNGVPYDLSAAQSVKLRWRQRGVTQEREMQIENPEQGIVRYFPDGDDFFPGDVSFEVEITNATGEIISSQDLIGPLKVRRELG